MNDSTSTTDSTTDTTADMTSGSTSDTTSDTTAAPSFADLGRALLERADLEVVTSLVELPPSFRAPAHRHPGEEFAYVIEGGVHFWQQGMDGESYMAAGTYGRVPLNVVHSIRTDERRGAKLIVFRVHTPGAPERELVDVHA